jgi:hypothetical protein
MHRQRSLHRYSCRFNWLKQAIPFKVFWVSENGSVRVE